MALLLALCLTSLVLCASYVPPAELAQEGAAVQPAEAVQPAREPAQEECVPAADEPAAEPERPQNAADVYINGVLRGELPVLHHLVDLVHGEGAADHAGVVEARVLGRGDGHALADLGHAVAAGAAGELGEYLRAPAVHALGELGAARDALVGGEVEGAAALGWLFVYEVGAGVDKADAALGALLVVAQAALGLHLVNGGGGEGAHAGHADAVADAALVDVDRAPEYAVVVFLIAAGHLVRFLPLIIGLGWLSPP